MKAHSPVAKIFDFIRANSTGLLKLTACVSIVLGVTLSLVSLLVIPRLGDHSLWLLSERFSVGSEDSEKYDGLYQFARDVVLSRTAEVKFIQIMLAISLLGNGVLAWGLGNRTTRVSLKDQDKTSCVD